MVRSDITAEDCPEFYRGYLATLPEDVELVSFMKRQAGNFPEFLRSIPDDKWDYRYANGKWTTKEVLIHILDTERVFQYRALRFGRKDSVALPGFEQNDWAENCHADRYTPGQIIASYEIVRASTIDLFRTFTDADLKWRGVASGNSMSVGAIGFMICGHQRYHRDLLRERYLDRSGYFCDATGAQSRRRLDEAAEDLAFLIDRFQEDKAVSVMGSLRTLNTCV